MKRVAPLLAACVAVVSAIGLYAQQADLIGSTNNTAGVLQSVPRLIMFSGTVKDLSGRPLTGPVDLNFAIYKEQADAAPLWQESQTLNVDEQGHYTALLGAMQPEGLPVDLFTSGEARWLGVSAGKLPEQPRVLLVSVPYALKANDAEMLGGKPASAYALAPAEGTSSGGLGSGGTGTPACAGTAKSGCATSDVAAPGKPKSGPKPNLTGTGTKNYLPVWTDSAGTLGNSVIYQSSGLVGIGTTTPAARLDVAGSVGHFLVDTSGAQFRFTRGGANYFLASTAGGYFDFVANGLTPSDANASLKLAANGVVNFMAGNVGIGTLAPAQKLDVAGNIHSSGSVTAASFSGNGAGLTGVSASGLAAGTYSNALTFSNAGNSFTGNGSGLTSVAAATATTAATATNALALGSVAAAKYARLDIGNSFTGNQAITGNLSFTGTLNSSALVLQHDLTDASATSGNCSSGAACVSDNVLAGYGAGTTATGANKITPGAVGATIGGGGGTIGSDDYGNWVSNDWGTVGGGYYNWAGSTSGTVTDAFAPTVGGGYDNWAAGNYATVAGGQANFALYDYDTVGGGYNNVAEGYESTVPGGDSNDASGYLSFAAGCQADAANDGSFVWSGYDGSACTTVSSSAAGQFVALAPGGVFFYTNTALTAGMKLAANTSGWSVLSDRNMKEHFNPVNGDNLLARLNAIPMSTWNYKAQEPRFRHMGPMAQDFYAAFGLGEDEKYINEIDGQGVALAGVQALYHLSLKKDAEIRTLRGEVQQLRARDERLTLQVQQLEKVQRQMATLEARLAQVEARTAKPQPRSVKRATAACLRSDSRNSKKAADRT